MKPILALGAAAIVLAGCAELQDPNNPNRNAQTGALIGGGLGAVFGQMLGGDDGERARGAIIGGALGAGVGGLIGADLDRQEAELRQTLGSDVGIVNTGEQLIVTMPQDILFATDSDTLRPTLIADLEALARSLNDFPNTTVNVIGHTDSDGDASYNQDLSERRAFAVASVLIASNVSPGRILAFGRGETQPVADNLTPAGKQQNRRVEIIITPTG